MVETVILEDKQEYIVVDTIEINNIKYLYLGTQKDLEAKSVMPVIRKLDQLEENIIGLETEEEYKKALKAYVEKWTKIENN